METTTESLQQTLQQTALFEQHQALGAKLVPFHGWQMPIHYGSQMAEHHQVRRQCGVFDVSHMLVCDLISSDLSLVEDFLNHVLTNDVSRLRPDGTDDGGNDDGDTTDGDETDLGYAQYTLMLNESGGILDDLIVYRLPFCFRLVLNCGCAESDLAWLQQQCHLFPRGAEIEIAPRRALSMLALQGPEFAKDLPALLGTALAASVAQLKPFTAVVADSMMVARTGYTGELGVEIVLPHEHAITLWQKMMALKIQPCGLGARDTLRLEAGFNLYGQDMTQATHPFESNVGWVVAMSKSDFIGKRALSERGQPSDHVLVGVRFSGKGVLRAGFALYVDDQAVGVLTSGSYSPSLSISVGLARVSRSAYQASAANFFVKIRGSLQPVEVGKPGFL